MPVPIHLRGIKGDECQCGRRASIRHCTSCGSSRIYGYAAEQWIERPNGRQEKVKLYRCLACSHRFTDPEREFCDAPPVSAALARQKIQVIAEAEARGEHLRPADKDLAKALKELGLAQTDLPDDARLKNTWFALKRAYIDDPPVGQSMSEFLETNLTALGLPSLEVTTILKWQRQEDLDSIKEDIASVSNEQPIVEPQ